MTFKLLLKDKIDNLCAFQQANFPDGWNKNQLESAFKSDNFFVLTCLLEEEIIGFISYSITSGSADILDIAVKKDMREQKIGSALLEKCLQNLISKGVKESFLEVRLSNVPAIGLYTKFGFSKISVRKKYYDDGEDAIVYKKELL